MSNYTYRTIILAKKLPVRGVIEGEDGTSDTTYYNYINRYLPLDYAEEKTVDASSKIVSQPMQSGDVISDHMYREPVSVSLNGYFALNGRNWNNDTYDTISKTTDRLTSIQEVFEYIKNNGILCDIMTIQSDISHQDKIYYEENGELRNSSISPAYTRFLKRSNMALEKITWTEGLNDLKFSFHFKEVIAVELDEYEVDYADIDGPSVNYPTPSSLGSIMVQNGQLDEIVLSVLYEKGYLTNGFVEFLYSTHTIYKEMLISTGIAVAAGIIAAVAVAAVGKIAAAGAIGSAIAGSISTIVPVGTVIAAAAIAVAAVVIGIWKIVNWFQEKEKEKKMFKMINGSGTESLERLNNLLDKIADKINKVNSNLLCYTFNTDLDTEKNKNTLVYISLDDGDYSIEIELINGGENFKAIVKDPNEKEPYMLNEWLPCKDLNELNYETIWFKPNRASTTRVYLMNPSLSDKINQTNEELIATKKKLSGYSIWVSKGSVEENVKIIKDAIFDAIHENGFN